MKIGDLVYVPELDRYGFIKEIKPYGRIFSINSINDKTRQIDVIKVIDLLVEAVGLFKRLIVIIKMMFPKKTK